MGWYGNHWTYWQVAFTWVAMIVFMGLVIWVVWALVTKAARRPENDERGDDARRILDQRLARGEIDAEEYRRLRDLLAVKEPPEGGSANRQ